MAILPPHLHNFLQFF